MPVALIRERETVAQSADASIRQSGHGHPGELAERKAAVHAGGDRARDPSRADDRDCLAKYCEPSQSAAKGLAQQ